MSEPWSVAGYEVLHLVEGGSAGDLWAARELDSGELVALRRVGGEVDVEGLRRTVPLQADLPYAVRLRQVVDEGPVRVLVLDHVEGATLERVLDRRGSLEPGEVVTVGVPLALALAAAAARGLGHGSLTGASVWFAADGRPLLAGLGLSRGSVEPADDVAALATLCLGLLRPVRDPAPDVAALVEALEQGRARDPAARPDAAQLAALLRRAHAAVPVRLQAGTSARHARAPQPTPGPRSPGRLVVAGLVLLVAAGAAAGWWSGRGGEAPAPAAAGAGDARGAPSEASEPAAVPASGSSAGEAPGAGPAAPSTESDWLAVLDRLDQARAEAFSTADPAGLREVYAPGSAALAADSLRVAELRTAGRTAVGVRHAIDDVEVVIAGADRARLRVVDTLPAYEVLDVGGRLVGRGVPRAKRPQLVDLTRTSDGWRLVRVTPV